MLSNSVIAVDCAANCLFSVGPATIDISDLILGIQHRRFAGVNPV
jgi:hypothetical protein